MFHKCLIYITPHNWYDHVLKGQVNRPLKMVEQFYNHKRFSEALIVNRLHPFRILKVKKSNRQLLLRKLFFNLFFDCENKVFYIEHCIPFGKLEELILPYILKYVLKQTKQSDCFLWISDPKSVGLILKLKNYHNLFDAYDDWSLSPFYKNRKRHMKYINRGYNIAKDYAELILTNTIHMKKKLSTHVNKVELICNTSSLKIENVNIKKNNKRKYVGYIGNIHERLDMDLLESVIKHYPRVKFIFVGKNDFQSKLFDQLLANYSNTSFTGPKDYKDIPRYISKFDVCIVPHVVNEYTLSQDSMKIYDYLAYGKPIVSTEIPPADLLNQIIYVGHTRQEFVKKLATALNENNDGLKNERLTFMKENTWSKKVDHICKMLED
ncbi:glycosyltransferase [Sporolactobacillus shoreicorticis]|uniref:Glycosyltransferase n=1 Tax=Sporolactobacillus shoreicorticis TaxID=1923877 RepID=A0ABW5S3G4_9BACL|nr:glycosyltransferase [Sporolactobacillus shoreicorticis]MCO7124178.1 glycosyltransferase [Sporolactobacillus shoreicorticis]